MTALWIVQPNWAGSISGRITGLDGTSPLNAVTIQCGRVRGAADELALDLSDFLEWSDAVQSDAEGRFAFSQLPEGHYRFRCHGLGRYLLPTNRVSIASDASAVATVHLQIAPFKKGVWKVYRQVDGLAADYGYDLSTTPDGKLFFGGYGGGCLFDGIGFETVRSTEGPVNALVKNVVADARGDLYLGTVEDVFRIAPGGRLEKLPPVVTPHPGPFRERLVISMTGDSRGGVWVGNHYGVSYICREYRRDNPLDWPETASNRCVTAIHPGRADALWLGLGHFKHLPSHSLRRWQTGVCGLDC